MVTTSNPNLAPGVYQGRITGHHYQAPLQMALVIVPQMSASASQVAKLPFGLTAPPKIGSNVWVAYQSGDPRYPVVLTLPEHESPVESPVEGHVEDRPVGREPTDHSAADQVLP